MAGQTHDDRQLKMLTMLDECSRECLAFAVVRSIQSDDVLEVLADFFT